MPCRNHRFESSTMLHFPVNGVSTLLEALVILNAVRQWELNFVIGRNCVQHVCPAMPTTSGYTREQALELLEVMGNDKACACCYFTYYRKFLDDQDKLNAEQICKDCDCDFKHPPSKRRRTERNRCVEQ